MVAECSPCKQFTIMSDGDIMSPEGARRRPGSARRPLSAITNNNPGAGLSPGKLAFPVKQQQQQQETQKPAPAPKQAHTQPKAAPKEKGASTAAVVLGAVALAAVVAAAFLLLRPSVAPQQQPASVPTPAPAGVLPEEVHDVIVDEEAVDGSELFWDWTELAPGKEDLFEDVAEEGMSFDDVPWAQSLISGPIRMDAGLLGGVDPDIVSGGMAGVYARLALNGEMFLFADVVDQAPVAMLSLDGCAAQHDLAPEEPPAGCFAVYPARGGWGLGCVGDAEEARDWEDAMKHAPCE